MAIDGNADWSGYSGGRERSTWNGDGRVMWRDQSSKRDKAAISTQVQLHTRTWDRNQLTSDARSRSGANVHFFCSSHAGRFRLKSLRRWPEPIDKVPRRNQREEVLMNGLIALDTVSIPRCTPHRPPS